VTAYEQVLHALADAGEAGVAPGSLAKIVGFTDNSSCRRAVRRAVDSGHARRDELNGRIYIIESGTAVLSSPARSEAPAPDQLARPPDNGIRLADVDAATMPLPEPLRAMIRWQLAAAVFRYHCRAVRPHGHPGGIAAGPTNVGKTLVAHIVGQALGLTEYVVEPARQPHGALS
jgi:hypothetical protein